MATPTDWEKRAASYLKGRLKQAGVTYDDLASRMNKVGFSESKAGITNKISRGAFTATFFLAALSEIGDTRILLDEFS